MNYHINTIPIWDNFKAGGECPLCTLRAEVEKTLISQYLNEAVMADSYRADVNRLGFCARHFKQLYAGENKLGLALQTHTRFKTLAGGLKLTAKGAKDDIKYIRSQLSGCVICNVIDFNMKRYFKTIPKMFAHEEDFPALMDSGKGFCINHYACLMENAGHAGSKSKAFAEAVADLQSRNIQRILQELDFFCDKFDYRNKDKPWGNSKDSLPRAINKIHGNIIE